ncbi:MAG: MbcA/ParS/Xre antitoxin family protein, partial [Parafilimonas sp.]
ASLVGITHRTIRNKKGNEEIFNIAQTERLRKLHLLFEEGNDLFNNKDQFNQWLQKPSYGLDYNLPAELLQQPGGLDKVMNELNSIKFGDTI